MLHLTHVDTTYSSFTCYLNSFLYSAGPPNPSGLCYLSYLMCFSCEVYHSWGVTVYRISLSLDCNTHEYRDSVLFTTVGQEAYEVVYILVTSLLC